MATETARLQGVVSVEASAAQRTLQNFDKSLKGFAKSASSTMVGFLGADLVTAAVSAGAAALKMGMDYEDGLNMIEAVSGATKAEMDKVAKTAIGLGNDLTLPATSAADAADAMLELSKAGLSLNDTMAAAKGTLQLAAAGAIAEGEAAKFTANMLNAFNLEGKKATKVANLFAAAANASSAEVSDIALASQQAAAVFHSAGMSVDEMTTAIAQMSKAGINGSDAGTSLKTMLLRLQKPSEDATVLMKGLGIEVYDTQGNMKSMEDLVKIFSKSLNGLTQQQRSMALATIFGSDAIRAGNIVLAGGTEEWKKNSKAMSDNEAAARLAEARTKGLRGAIGGLVSQLETVALQIYNAIAPALTTMFRTASAVFTAVTGFVKDNMWAVKALAAMYGGYLLTKVAAATKAFVELQRIRVAIWAMDIKGALIGAAASFSQAAAGAGKAVGAFKGLKAASGSLIGQLGGVKSVAKGAAIGLGILAISAIQGGRKAKAAKFVENIVKDAPNAKLQLKEVEKAIKDVEKAHDNANGMGIGSFFSVGSEAHARTLEQLKLLRSKRDELEQQMTADKQAAEQERLQISEEATKKATKLFGKEATARIAANHQIDQSMLESFEATEEKLGKISESFNSTTDVVAAFGDQTTVTKKQVLDFYREQIEMATKWESNLKEAVRRGLDEGVINRIAEAGPQAGALLDAILSDTSGKLIDSVNESEDSLATILGNAQGTVRQMDSLMAQSTTKTSQDLANKWRISETVARMGSKATVEAVAKELGLGKEKVKKVAEELGLTLPTQIQKNAVDKAAEKGRSFIEGLKQGLNDEKGSLLGKAKEIADSVINTFKGIFGIASPSKVMIGYGQQLGKGLEIGIGRSAYGAARAMGDLSFNAMPSLSGANGLSVGQVSINVDASGAQNGQDVVNAIRSQSGTIVDELVRELRRR